MPVDDYLRLDTGGYQYLVAQNFGAPIEYPFYGSALHRKGVAVEDEVDEDEDEVENVDPSFFVEE